MPCPRRPSKRRNTRSTRRAWSSMRARTLALPDGRSPPWREADPARLPLRPGKRPGRAPAPSRRGRASSARFSFGVDVPHDAPLALNHMHQHHFGSPPCMKSEARSLEPRRRERLDGDLGGPRRLFVRRLSGACLGVGGGTHQGSPSVESYSSREIFRSASVPSALVGAGRAAHQRQESLLLPARPPQPPRHRR